MSRFISQIMMPDHKLDTRIYPDSLVGVLTKESIDAANFKVENSLEHSTGQLRAQYRAA